MMRLYGICYTRDELPQPIGVQDVVWFDSEQEATQEFVTRDEKYWPSVLVSASIEDITVERLIDDPFAKHLEAS